MYCMSDAYRKRQSGMSGAKASLRHLYIVLLQRKPAPAHFSHIADHHERFRVDVHDELIQMNQLPMGDDGHDDGLIGSQEAGFCPVQGAAPVHVLYDSAADFLKMFADDLRLCLALPDDQHAVQNHRIDEDEQKTVKDLLRIGKKHLAYEDQKIKGVHGAGHGQTELFL